MKATPFVESSSDVFLCFFHIWIFLMLNRIVVGFIFKPVISDHLRRQNSWTNNNRRKAAFFKTGHCPNPFFVSFLKLKLNVPNWNNVHIVLENLPTKLSLHIELWPPFFSIVIILGATKWKHYTEQQKQSQQWKSMCCNALLLFGVIFIFFFRRPFSPCRCFSVISSGKILILIWISDLD